MIRPIGAYKAHGEGEIRANKITHGHGHGARRVTNMHTSKEGYGVIRFQRTMWRGAALWCGAMRGMTHKKAKHELVQGGVRAQKGVQECGTNECIRA